jgi:hypothetical protein
MKTYKAGNGIPKGKYAELSEDELEAVAQELLAQMKTVLALTRAAIIAEEQEDLMRAMQKASPADRLRLAIAGSKAGHRGVR